MITRTLMDRILSEYSLPLNGRHGVSHWARVLENGRRLAELTGADLEVVELFAVFHDSRRTNESVDDGHGVRGAAFAQALRGEFFDISQARFEQLSIACTEHTLGMLHADLTVEVCWDSDRLDLGRAGITPVPSLLCTPAAQDLDMIAWANERSLRRYVPELVEVEWGIHIDRQAAGSP
jgi:uncharacterized protein